MKAMKTYRTAMKGQGLKDRRRIAQLAVSRRVIDDPKDASMVRAHIGTFMWMEKWLRPRGWRLLIYAVGAVIYVSDIGMDIVSKNWADLWWTLGAILCLVIVVVVLTRRRSLLRRTAEVNNWNDISVRLHSATR